ncbi:hypothetical protein WJX73_010609 [Symbiochloris irregularis]|uniref:Sacsin/Nov domain-containing protein n=1 Tax=Symbiochloris irregularis TaxID=706552 RepID=A0AAW1P8E7_9CHLO
MDPIVRLRQMLQDYGEGTSIFKELLQNADDAGANKGPALYAYNNAVLTEGDLQSISRIGDSIKRSESNKTGRFGVGFNATYQITDAPSFCSGKHCVYLDPHGLYLPHLSALNPGKMIDFVAAKPSLLQQFPDQFQPFCAFGCDMRTEFPGTLFRLPLRTAGLAIKSRISQQVYDPARVKRMLDAVASEAVTMMLFLRNVETLQILDWREGQQGPCLHFTSSLAGVTPQLRAQRHLFSQASKVPARHALVAARIPAGSDAGVSGVVEGQAFCFLPLPARTGLPLHINAFFELSSNRRDVWYAPDLIESSKLRSDWNISLLEDVVAPCYCQLLVNASQLLGPSAAFHALWPSSSQTMPWACITSNVYQALRDCPVVWTSALGGRWLRPSEAIYADQSSQGNTALLAASVALARIPMSMQQQ